MPIGINIQIRGVKEVAARLAVIRNFFRSQAFRTVLEDAKNKLVLLARRAAPARSFALRNSIDGIVENFGTDDVLIRVGTPVTYAPHIEFGSKPRTIVPKNKRVLFWVNYDAPRQRLMAGGRRVGAVFTFASEVSHPGNPPQPFMRPALAKVKPRLIQAIERVLNQELLKAKGA